jgi:hypothetical protein
LLRSVSSVRVGDVVVISKLNKCDLLIGEGQECLPRCLHGSVECIPCGSHVGLTTSNGCGSLFRRRQIWRWRWRCGNGSGGGGIELGDVTWRW